MSALQGIRAFAQPENDDFPSMQEIYGSIMSRANATLRTAGMVLSVVVVIWMIGGVVALVALFFLGKYYMKHHRIPGTLVRYQGQGDWVIVALPDGTEIVAHSPLADLPEGAEVVVAIRRGGAFVVAPPVRLRKPIEDEGLIEVVGG